MKIVNESISLIRGETLVLLHSLYGDSVVGLLFLSRWIYFFSIVKIIILREISNFSARKLE